MEMISLDNPLIGNFFFGKHVIKQFTKHYHPALPRLIYNTLKNLHIFKYSTNLDYFAKYYITSENSLRDNTDTLLVIKIIKFSLRVYHNNTYFSNFAYLVEDMITNMISKSEYILSILKIYFYKSDYEKGDPTNKIFIEDDQHKVNIKRKFGSFLCNYINEYSAEKIDWEYLDEFLINLFKILYIFQQPQCFIKLAHKQIHKLSFIQHYASSSNIIYSLNPILNKIIMKNIEIYLINRPLMFWKNEFPETITNIKSFEMNKLLFWVNEGIEINNINCNVNSRPKDNDSYGNFNSNPTCFLISLLKLQIAKFKLIYAEKGSYNTVLIF